VDHHGVWELVFLIVIMKIPIVYLGAVIFYAIRAEPNPEEGAAVAVQVGPDDSGSGWSRGFRRRRLPGRPHGGPARTYARSPRTAVTRADGNSR
jgi:hypothetical protein